MDSKIEYVRKQIPRIDIPPCTGTVYEDMVPDTLDIAERISLAVNGLTGPTDPDADYEIYFWANFFHNPPVMTHDFSDWCQVKFFESLPLLRIASGSNLNKQVDRAWMDVILKSIGPDGLFYIPLEGRPWSRMNVYGAGLPVYRADGTKTTIEDKSVTQFSSPFLCSRVIAAMTIHYLLSHNPTWKDIIERMIQRLAELAVYGIDYCYFPPGFYEPNAEVGPDANGPRGGLMIDFGGARLIQGLAQYYRVTGYEPARGLAGKLVKMLKEHSGIYDKEGRFLLGQPYKETPHAIHGGHFHSCTISLLSLLEYATATKGQDLVSFVRKSYEWARVHGSPLVGVFPTMINSYRDILVPPYYDEFEICELADMIAIALKLTETGAGDYWDDVDRWVRNHFAEGQLTRVEWVYRKPRYMDLRPIFPNESADRVAERHLGAFGGWMTGSDWSSRMGVMHCCTGNATRSLYYVWEHIVSHEGNVLRINLLLNHASKWADVYSYNPYEGRLDIKIKVACEKVSVRVPEWIKSNSDDVACGIDGEKLKPEWDGRYVNIGAVKPGNVIVITYPIREYETKELLIDSLYTLTIKGNTVVAIKPEGNHCPLYQRAHYRENHVRWHKTMRFVPNEQVHW